MKHTASRVIDKHFAVDQCLDIKSETDDFTKFIINDIDRGILDSYMKPVLEKIGESYLITPMDLETIDYPSEGTIEVRKSVDITPVTKCVDCEFLKTEIHTDEPGIWRKECTCTLGHWPMEIYSFFCADGKPREEENLNAD